MDHTHTDTHTPTATEGQARRVLRSMGTDVLFALDLPAGSEQAQVAFDHAELELARLVDVFNRFDPTSELRQLERHRVLHASSELREVVELAIDARYRSDGRFDPTILPSLRALGYDRSIEHVRDKAVGREVWPHAPGVLAVDPHSGLVALGDHVAIDLGGIAKGWIADRIATLLSLTAPALVDAGGDISCTPRAGDQPWVVTVAGPGDGTCIELLAGGIATSGVDRRRWIDATAAGSTTSALATDATRHHVVDPRTGDSARTDLVRVTTVAGSCTTAEVAATSMLVGGSASLDELADAFGVAWLAEPIDPDHPVIRSEELR